MILARPTATTGNPGWPALKPCFRNVWFDQARITQRLERGFVLQQRGALIAPSARSGGLDDVDSGPDGRGYIQMTPRRQGALYGQVEIPDMIAKMANSDREEKFG
jgi:hypothetical protein